MPYVVTEPCLDCKYTDCASVCPVQAFHEGPDHLYINPNTCIDCDACLTECPVDAIYSEQNVPDKWKNYIAINRDECEKYPVIQEKIRALKASRCVNSSAEP